MNKKVPFNWLGWIAISVFVASGIYGIYYHIAFPDSNFSVNNMLFFWLPIWAGAGGLIVAVVYTLSSRNVEEKFALKHATLHENRPATVVSKTSEVSGNSLRIKTEYYVTFNVDGYNVTFDFPSHKYNGFASGQAGLLSYKEYGEHLFFINFNCQVKCNTIEKKISKDELH